MHCYDLIIFDWDGTLVDSQAKIVNCFHAAARDTGLPIPATHTVCQLIGLSLDVSFRRLHPDVDDVAIASLVDRYREHFIRHDATPLGFFPGVRDGLAALVGQGLRLAVATGKARRGLQAQLTQFDVTSLFTATRCADESIAKPHPQMVLDLLALTGCDPRRALVVGDTTYDIEMASRAGVDAVAVDCGAHRREALLVAGAKACLTGLPELQQWLRRATLISAQAGA